MKNKRNCGGVLGVLCLLFFSLAPMLCFAAVSVEVQENIDTLVRTNKCVDCNLSGAELNRLDLSGADLRGADLSGATFFLADLSNADLRGAKMNGTQLGGADLADADLRQADLRGVKIAGAYLVGARVDGTFSDVSVTDEQGFQSVTEKTYIPDDAVSKKAAQQKNVTIGDRRDFGPVPPQIDQARKVSADKQGSGPDQQDAPPVKTVSPVEELVVTHEPVGQDAEITAPAGNHNSSLAGQNQSGQAEESLPGANVSNSAANNVRESAGTVPVEEEMVATIDLNDKTAPVKGDEFSERPIAEVDNVQAETKDPEINGDQPMPDQASIEEAAGEVLPDLVVLQKQVAKSRKCYACDLAGSDFSGKNLDGGDFEGSDFTGAMLEGADFEDANLKGVSFKNARLKNAKFNGADLYKADFSGADLTGAEFSKTLIDEANFENANGYGELMLNQPQ